MTDERDGPVKAVVQELRERGCRTFVAGTQSLPDGTRGVTASIEPGAPRGIHDDDGRFVRFDELRSVWAWRPHSPKAGHPDPDVSRYLDKEWRLALAGLAQGSQPLWVNHPRAERWLEGNKLAQLALARACGLAVPETIQSSVPDHVVAFAERFSAVAVKTAGGFLRQVDDCARFAYTQRMTAEELHRSRRAIAAAPVLVQPYVEKRFEVRVTAVGDRIFATKIDSQASERTRIDWRRYDFGSVEHESYALPTRLRAKVARLMERADLFYAAIDLIVTPGGDHVFLELNPSGQYQWLETLTGAPITAAIADLLSRGSRRPVQPTAVRPVDLLRA
ncbi:MAG TPA: hypothetical protein VE596_19540 [Gaiellaceae bacterium]|nr:hypothetical protein [Gaiellaceae bacterium]